MKEKRAALTPFHLYQKTNAQCTKLATGASYVHSRRYGGDSRFPSLTDKAGENGGTEEEEEEVVMEVEKGPCAGGFQR